MSNTEREALLPCPFCGSVANVTFVSDFRITSPRTGRRAACSGCGVSAGAFGTADEAVAAWNRRASTPQAPGAAPDGKLSFVCTNGCGECGLKLRDFVNHATQAQEGDPWVTVAYEPEIVSDCCGHPVEIYDERTGDTTPVLAASPPPPAEQAEPLVMLSEDEIEALARGLPRLDDELRDAASIARAAITAFAKRNGLEVKG